MMKPFAWNEEKNRKLKEERGVGFEDFVRAIDENRLLAIVPNKNYPNQQMFVVGIHDYAYVVPFTEDKDKFFLKTLYPSRKYTRQYIEKGKI